MNGDIKSDDKGGRAELDVEIYVSMLGFTWQTGRRRTRPAGEEERE